MYIHYNEFLSLYCYYKTQVIKKKSGKVNQIENNLLINCNRDILVF